jgi:CDP-diacylglycerol pyrophosphatase
MAAPDVLERPAWHRGNPLEDCYGDRRNPGWDCGPGFTLIFLSGGTAVGRNEHWPELSRRQFVGYSGTVGAAALAGVRLAPGHCPPKGGQADLCGSTSDTGPRFYLWERAMACTKAPAQSDCLVTTSNFVVLPGDPQNSHDFLLVPTKRIKGIECPKLWTTYKDINYWDYAWSEATRHGGKGQVTYVVMGVNYIGLGVNSAGARRQDQLHIHMAGFRPGQSKAINALAAKITKKPSDWPHSVIEVGGYLYRALHVPDLSQNAFVLLYDNVVKPLKADMGNQTLLVTNSDKGGFCILNSEGALKDPAYPGRGGTSTCDFLLVYG